jgi:hypothetical protein
MRSKVFFTFVILVAVAYAKDPKPYQTGTLLQMDSVKCGMDIDEDKKNAGVCQEYLLQAENVIYRIRPRGQKHPVLLPVGNRAQFRLKNDKMLLRSEDFKGKEREYAIVSMTPRSEGSAANASPSVINHLQ